jgi:hypothetical protein
MKITRTLLLAGLTVLSLGVGTAMAQSESNGDPGIPYWTLQRQEDALRQAEARNGNQVQSGSSDVEQAKPGALGHALPFSPWDYSTLANPG